MNEVTIRILKELSADDFYSGNQLSSIFCISRTAVWKHIQTLRRYGVDIYSIPGKGYKLAENIELLDQAFIYDALKGLDLISDITVLSTVNSTNSYLREVARNSEAGGSVVFAESQSAGRGRRGKNWISPFGKNIYCSLLWRYCETQFGIGGLSLAIGIAIVDVLESMGISGVGLKWPNDLLCDGRKLAGILLEMSGDPNGAGYLIIGIGINVDMTRPAKDWAITQPWVDLTELSGDIGISRNELSILLLRSINSVLLKYQKDGLSKLIDRWSELDVMFGKEVVIQGVNESLSGIAQGIDDRGALLLLVNNKIHRVHSGEVSLRLAENSGDLCF